MKAGSMFTIGAVLFVFGVSTGWTQEKQAISWKVYPKFTKYTEQHRMDVGDIPGHQIRIAEIHRTFPNDPPKFYGVQVTEQWSHIFSDYVNDTGPHWGYNVYVLGNGDKIFSRQDGTAQTTVNPDGSKKVVYSGVARITGGTGKFKAIRGILRYQGKWDPAINLNERHVEGEYWMEK